MPRSQGKTAKRKAKKEAARRRREEGLLVNGAKAFEVFYSSKPKVKQETPRVYFEKIDILMVFTSSHPITYGTVSALRCAGVLTIGDIMERGETGLLKISGLGPKKVDKIRKALAEYKLELPK